MRKTKQFRTGGLAVAAGLLLAQLAAMPVQATVNLTGKDISECDYVYEVGELLDADTNITLTCEEIGVPATETVSEVWINISGETGNSVMPAIGYNAPGCGEFDWYSDGEAYNMTADTMTLIFEIPEEYPLPNEFMLQYWWGEIDAVTVNSVGLMTGSSGNIGFMTRKGDVNGDRTVSVADAVDLAAYLAANDRELVNAANGDLDHSNTLNAIDLTLLKRGLLDGTLGGQGIADETAMEFVSHINMGWNLGNTLDATGSGNGLSPYAYETAWGVPITTKAMIDAVKNAGFNTVRVPVSWGQKMGSAPDYTVDSAWMDRVQEVVDYVIDNGMYCILNSHHDTDWQVLRQNVMEQETAQLKALWTQIANRFEGYDEHLIFETLNEPRLVGDANEWNGGDAEARACVNTLNAAALEAIRATGGNNEKRFVMLPTYCASPSSVTVNDMVLPDDDHIIVSVHAYTPYSFALDKNGTAEWSEASGSYDIVQNFEIVKNAFLSKGVPVIIGEFGAVNKNNEATRAAWVEYYLKTADSYGIPCVWWDNNCFDTDGENFGLLDRSSCTIRYTQIMEAMVRATANRG